MLVAMMCAVMNMEDQIFDLACLLISEHVVAKNGSNVAFKKRSPPMTLIDGFGPINFSD